MKTDGGPAFPIPCQDGGIPIQDGMSLRDWFAGQAMNGLVHDILIEQHWEDVLMKEGLETSEFPAFLAQLSYATAYAMLAERAKP